jgi:hypothetical protein
MTYSDFCSIVQARPDAVVLMEGRRTITPAGVRCATELAQKLASAFPQLRFRSGNATGADAAFSAGVARVAPQRLQIVAPYATHRKSARIAGANYASPEELTPKQVAQIVAKTVVASPARKDLIALRDRNKAFNAKAAYLLRDTMKVLGHSENFPPPTVAFFWIDLADPQAGGTGHTIRVCRQEGVACVFQNDWENWCD